MAWGTGNVLREFLYVEDAAEGILLAAEHYDKPEPGNLASGKEITIRESVYLANYSSRCTSWSGCKRFAKPTCQARLMAPTESRPAEAMGQPPLARKPLNPFGLCQVGERTQPAHSRESQMAAQPLSLPIVQRLRWRI